MKHYLIHTLFLLTLCMLTAEEIRAQNTPIQKERDSQVLSILQEYRDQWRDLNVPSEDGQILHDLIVSNNYTSALEIDENRQKQAIENIRRAGLADFVEFRLGDAHQIVRELKGPFDFVFSDADKDWYTQYFKDIHPKLLSKGTFTAHNVLQNLRGIPEFLDYVNRHPAYVTTIDRTSRSGISISRKK